MCNPRGHGWRWIVWVAAISCVAWSQTRIRHSNRPGRLTNRMVESWTRRGLAPAAITARIDSAAAVRFDLSTRALLHLQRKGVPASVMAAMIRRQAALRMQSAHRRQKRRRRQQLLNQRRALAAARAQQRRFLAQKRELAHFGALGSPLHSRIRTRLMSRLAWIKARDAAGNDLGEKMGFLLGVSEIAAPATQQPPAMVRIRLGQNEVYSRARLLAWHRHAGVMLFKLPARTPPGLAAERFRESLPRSWRPRPGGAVYWAMGRSGNHPTSALQLCSGVLINARASGSGDAVIQSRISARSSAGWAGAPVFSRRGLWLGMLLGCRPSGEGKELCRMRPARTILELSVNRRAMVLAAYRDSTLPDRIYIEDQTGHHYGRRLQAELARQGWKFTVQVRQAHFYMRLALRRRGHQRWETLQVYRVGPRSLRLIWNGAERIMLFRRSAARRLAGDWLHGRISPAASSPAAHKP